MSKTAFQDATEAMKASCEAGAISLAALEKGWPRLGSVVSHVATLPDGTTVNLPAGTVLREAPAASFAEGPTVEQVTDDLVRRIIGAACDLVIDGFAVDAEPTSKAAVFRAAVLALRDHADAMAEHDAIRCRHCKREMTNAEATSYASGAWKACMVRDGACQADR